MSQSGRFDLGIPHQKQAEQNDCWATCVSMIATWKGVAMGRAEIFTAASTHLASQGYCYGEMATLAEANHCAKKMSGDRVAFEAIKKEELVGEIGSQKVIALLNARRPLMVTMANHCWVISGYTAAGAFLIHNVGAESGPQELGRLKFKELLADAMVLKP